METRNRKIYSPKLSILLGAGRLPSKAQEENHEKILNLSAALISMSSLGKKKQIISRLLTM